MRGLSSSCLRVSLEFTSAHQCPACACGQKTTLRAPRWRSSRGTAPKTKSRPAAQRTGGHRRVATRKTTGDLTTRRGAGHPVRRAEWMTVLRYGHLRSAPVVVDASLRTEWEPPALRAALWVSTRQSWRLLDGFLPLRDEGNLQFPVITARFENRASLFTVSQRELILALAARHSVCALKNALWYCTCPSYPAVSCSMSASPEDYKKI